MRLKELRKQAGKTQEAVANELGVKLPTYRSWEQGAVRMTAANVILLADYFGVSIDYLLGETDADPRLIRPVAELLRTLTEEELEKVESYIVFLTDRRDA